MSQTHTAPPIFAIVGPTASGKSALAIEVALALGTEILSADSMQVYRGMDIGTAKPTPGEQATVPHHGLDIAEPNLPFSVADYCRHANALLERFSSEGRPLIVCGGTGLYFKALFEGLAEAPPPDFAFRREMEALADESGTGPLHARLQEVDPESASRIHPHDRKRIIRALEIHHSTGQSKTDYEASQPRPAWQEWVRWFGISRSWEDLDSRINSRVVEMFQAGLVEEVRALLDRGCSRSSTSMQGLGYKEVLDHLEGQFDLAETVERVQQKTRRFSRRQMTWFRPNLQIHWYQVSPADSLESLVPHLLESLGKREVR